MFRIACGRASLRITRGAQPGPCPPSSSFNFHTTAHTQESYRKRQSRIVKKRNTEKQIQREELLDRTRPHPALGHSPGDEQKWLASDLAQILVSPHDRRPLPPPETRLETPPASSTPRNNKSADMSQPIQLTPSNFGIGNAERELLFNDLPSASAMRAFAHHSPNDLKTGTSQAAASASILRERLNAELLARTTSLSNASAKGIAYENRRRIIAEFSEPGKPNDTGRSEVQAALFTWKIRNLWNHLENARRDIHNIRTLRRLIHQRAQVLKYLRRTHRERYLAVLERLGLDPRAVEGEIIVRL
ncbi:hypothetical protein BS47DRAFT_1327721 [Hydnum rufescens UP504]|uniref:30S ribosomal protein S15 n=1 Tax=Hydnum rufescens UP504 TaxID=1448309 RepID=A0A9P6DYJ0_9AGAM|nr:hypothetical protein BS47DRAFT_1327721 [Hydnum rufescens UP504]